jgi:serine/threonine protein phosphatase 1
LAITYAIPDIHGGLGLLVKAVEVVGEDVAARSRPPFKIVFLGDYVDRGPESAQVLKLLRTTRRPRLSFYAGTTRRQWSGP